MPSTPSNAVGEAQQYVACLLRQMVHVSPLLALVTWRGNDRCIVVPCKTFIEGPALLYGARLLRTIQPLSTMHQVWRPFRQLGESTLMCVFAPRLRTHPEGRPMSQEFPVKAF